VLIGKSEHYLKTLTPAHQKREMPAPQNQSSTILIANFTTKQHRKPFLSRGKQHYFSSKSMLQKDQSTGMPSKQEGIAKLI